MAEEKKEEQKKEDSPKQEEDKKEEKQEEDKKEEKKEEKKEKPEEKKEKPKKEEKDEEEEVEVPKKFKKLVEEIESMPVVDLAELVKILEKKFGVSSAPVAAAPAAAPAAGGAEPEEKSAYKVMLTEVGEKKIDVIKAVRDATQKGLKDSKALVDSVSDEPQVIKENAKKEDAEEIKKNFEEAGATVELQ